MMQAPPPATVLIATPTGRDAALAAMVLSEAGIATKICRDLSALAAAIDPDAGTVLVAEEALSGTDVDIFLRALRAQEPWSDLPILLLMRGHLTRTRGNAVVSRLEPSTFVTLLERPFHSATLVSSVQAALRARRRQWQVRDLLAQRDEAQLALAISEERLRVANESAHIGTWDWIPEGGPLVWDDRCRAHFGMSPGTPVTYEIFRSCLHPDDVAPTDATVAKALDPDGPGTYDTEYRAIGKEDGVVRWIAAAGKAVFDAHRKPVRFSGTTRDITASKKAEEDLRVAKQQAESANAAKDRFLATLSHELRTPLNPVLMCTSSYLSMPGVPQDVREDMEMIHRNVQLEARLIDDLLDITRIANGKIVLRSEIVDLHHLLRETIPLCITNGSTHPVNLKLEAVDGQRHVRADRARLQQVFWNLINNAVKFSPNESPVVVRAFNPRRGRIAVEVKDHGIGIDPERIEQLFGAFQQNDQSITRRFGGLGLGLAISKALVEMHDGAIRATSDGPGHGAAFTVELATCNSDASARLEESTATPR